MITLQTELTRIRGLSPNFLAKLKKLGIVSVKDLLWHFPYRYDDFSKIVKIADLELNQPATISGIIQKVDLRRTWRRKMVLVEAMVVDETGGVKAVWFNQPYIAKILKPGLRVNFAGKVASTNGDIYLSNPAYEPLRGLSETRHTAGLIPVYTETKGLTSRGLRYLVKPILRVLPPIQEFIPEEVLGANRLPEINSAIGKIHFPSELAEAEGARQRFAFEDLFLLQLNNLKLKTQLQGLKAPVIDFQEAELQKLFKILPFELTASQSRSLMEILGDLKAGRPMNRLLQGDVGSGKTVVAAIAAIATAQSGRQAVFMAPTEVLARQHHQTLEKTFSAHLKNFGIEIGLLVSGLKGKEKKQVVEEIMSGGIKIVTGTHALIQKNIKFKDLALIIIDEQHRFGVRQRAELAARGPTPTDTLTNAETELLYEDLSYKIRGIAFAVKKNIGLGHKENVYQQAFQEELNKAGIAFEREKEISIDYSGKKIGIYRPDFVIDGKIILELKAEPYTGRVHQKQLWSYLKSSNYKLALLVNFGGTDVEIKRLVFDTARGSQRGSASSPRQSAVLPHFLSMSATPIPRTLSLTLFGDLDLSVIDELPKGRKAIITKVVAPTNRVKAYAFVREEIKKGRQAFVICPRIEPSTNDQQQTTNNTSLVVSRKSLVNQWSDVKAVKEEYEKLSQKIFPDLKVTMLHGKLKSAEKERIMSDFKEGKTDILVSTSVIEVGVDVPNASIMIIEGAERFGLAQLYQFRGRIGRGEHQSFCLLFTDSSGVSVQERLNALLKAKNGFELAELDLRLRGPGQFLGEKQTGLPDLAMRSLNNIELIKAARDAASWLIKKDPEFSGYTLLREKLALFQKNIHLE